MELVQKTRSVLFIATVGFLTVCNPAYAVVMHLNPTIMEEILSETVPTADALGNPVPIDVEDFRLEWITPPISGVKFSLVKKSLQWVRVQEVLVLPRARLEIEVENVDAGSVNNASSSQGMTVAEKKGKIGLPIALVSGEKNDIEVMIQRGGNTLRGRLVLRFNPRPGTLKTGQRVFFDHSCSPYKLREEELDLSDQRHDWAFVGCRMIRVKDNDFQTSNLEAFVFWDNVGQHVQVGSGEVAASSTSIWPLRLRDEPGYVNLQAGGQKKIKFSYRIPKKLHDHSVSLGLGPYTYSFDGHGERELNATILGTLYYSYFFTEGVRIVAFSATALTQHFFTDLGAYIRFENFKLLDKRISINLLLGAHVIAFQSRGDFFMAPSFPQGLEVIFADFFSKGSNLALGGFLYPPVDKNAYFNLWLRWGNQTFVELNYFLWGLNPRNIEFSTSALGVSVGFPLFQFL